MRSSRNVNSDDLGPRSVDGVDHAAVVTALQPPDGAGRVAEVE